MTAALRPAALVVAAIVAVVWVRVWLDARAEFARAEAAEATGALDDAIDHYGYAMRAYSPLASAPPAAADALTRLAETAAARGDRATALRAWRRVRAGALSTRGLTCPFCDRLDATNQHIAAAMAAEQLALGQPTIRGRSEAQLTADHLALLRLDPLPHPAWAALAVLAFLGWVGGGFLLIWKGFDRALTPIKPAIWRYGGLVAGSFGLWLLALWRA